MLCLRDIYVLIANSCKKEHEWSYDKENVKILSDALETKMFKLKKLNNGIFTDQLNCGIYLMLSNIRSFLVIDRKEVEKSLETFNERCVFVRNGPL